MNEPRDIEQQRADRENRLRNEQRTDAADLKWLMGQKRGRRIVWRQLERAGVFRSSFNSNGMTMAFAEGMRNEGVRLLAQIHAHCPEAYALMAKEQGSE